MAKQESVLIEESSGNVFADLNLPNPEVRQTQVRLAVIVNRVLDQRGMTQLEAARLLRITQPKVSALQNYKLDGFSVHRLMQFINLLEYDVLIHIRPHKGSSKPAQISVVDAA